MDKEALFKPRLAEEAVEIPGVGQVRVRALSRAEALKVRGVEMSPAKLDRMLISMAMVDPVLTLDEVAQWQEASGAGEMERITEVITRLSGMEKTAAKSGVPGDGDD